MTAKPVNKNICRKTQGRAEDGNTCLQTPGTCESCPDWANRSKRVSQKVYIPNGNPAIGAGQAVESLGIYTFTVPLVPPSVNHYRVRLGRKDAAGRAASYETAEAREFKRAVAIFSRGRIVSADRYEVTIRIFLGKKKSGDIDNFAKCSLDSLVAAGVIRSDAAIDKLTMEKFRDWQNPRTEITIEAHQ